jgi:hypothetical protein
MDIYELEEWLEDDTDGRVPCTPEAVEAARAFVFAKWKERAAERMEKEPVDLSRSCKFGSLFVKMVFGGHVEGHVDHQYNVVGGEIVDLSADAADVRRLALPYRHDPLFFGNEEHLESLASCFARVEGWAAEFAPAAAPAAARP